MLRHMLALAILAVLMAQALPAAVEDSPSEILLWPDGVPGFEKLKSEKEKTKAQKNGEYTITHVDNPTLTVFLPPKDKATGTAVIMAPGGGHSALWVLHEGVNEAKWLNERGIAAFVLKYRLAREPGSPYKVAEHALQDGQRAVRVVRGRAAEWGIDPERIGLMGFSAGGEVTALVCANPDKGKPDAADPIDRLSARPDFQVLVYGGGQGIRGQNITKDMPPTFMVVGDNDNVANALVDHYKALKKAGVSTELHVYAKVGHGFGYRDNLKGQPVGSWLQRLEDFLRVEGMLTKK
jgi:acetyl esterase/lipase